MIDKRRIQFAMNTAIDSKIESMLNIAHSTLTGASVANKQATKISAAKHFIEGIKELNELNEEILNLLGDDNEKSSLYPHKRNA